MTAAPQVLTHDPAQLRNYLLALTFRACQCATESIVGSAKALLTQDDAALQVVNQAEKELDRLDREFDERAAQALLRATPPEVRELLASLKFIVDLERITDLMQAFAVRALAVGRRLEPADVADLAAMLKLLETMAADIYEALAAREVDRALRVLHTDAELDRVRNLILIRHLEGQTLSKVSEAIHVVAMAQSLERAGDHMKNLAEEICHLVTGHSLRHLLRTRDRSTEQMYIDHMRKWMLRHQ